MKTITLILLVPLGLLTLFSCNPPVNMPEKPDNPLNDSFPLHTINLPEGFEIGIYAAGIDGARSMSLSPSGTLFVGSRQEGNVYALQDLDNDNIVDTSFTIFKSGNQPNGVAFRDGDLYVAEINRILRFNDIEDKLANPGQPEIINDSYPTESHHGWKYIAFGPDNKLYVPVGAPCNICESEDPIFNTITRMDPDGSNKEIVHRGIRNTVGFTWHPKTNNLWFTDNGRDWMGDNQPADELNRATQDGLHFGYPYCHQGDLPDPDFGHKRNCDEFVPPAQNLAPHTAALGIEFYTADMFPPKYKNNVAFIAEHGSWNRTDKIGYRVTMVEIDNNGQAVNYTPFAYGWLDEASDEVWGRPVDIEFLPDGSMLVSDDFADVIYRISYGS